MAKHHSVRTTNCNVTQSYTRQAVFTSIDVSGSMGVGSNFSRGGLSRGGLPSHFSISSGGGRGSTPIFGCFFGQNDRIFGPGGGMALLRPCQAGRGAEYHCQRAFEYSSTAQQQCVGLRLAPHSAVTVRCATCTLYSYANVM